MADDGDLGHPIMSQLVTSTIANIDALAAKFAQIANRQDHGAAVKLLRDVLSNRLPTGRSNQLRRIIDTKDKVPYGVGVTAIADARRLLVDFEEFAAWADDEYNRPT